MSTHELYVRGTNDTEARGPFTVDQLVTLGESGQIDTETLFYDADTEQWVAISSNEELKNAIFPQKRKLVFKAKEAVKTLNVQKEEHKPITVEQMLAAAEGQTEDTKDKKNILVSQTICARIGMYAGMVTCLLSAAALVLPHLDIVAAFDYVKIAQHPLVILGLIDLLCGALLGLGVATTYPFIRFRAAFGVGFLGLLFWAQGQSMVALAVVLGSVGMYFCTVFLSYTPIITAALLALAGMGGFAYFMLT